MADEIIADGTADHPQLGLGVSDGDGGAQLTCVTTGGAADRAGLQQGDVVTQVGSRRVVDADSLIVAVRAAEPGDSVPVTSLRDGAARTTTATLGTSAS